MGMSGPTPHEYLIRVLGRVEWRAEDDKIIVSGDDWRNLVSAYRQAYDIPDDADDAAPVRSQAGE